MKADAKVSAQAATGDDADPASDGKSVDGPAPTTVAVVAAAPEPSVDTSAAPVVIPPATSSVIPQAAPAAAGQDAIVIANTPKTKAADPAAQQADPQQAAAVAADAPKTDTPKTDTTKADAPNTDTSLADAPKTDTPKAQAFDPAASQAPARADTDKTAAHPRDEVSTNTHHAAADTPAPVAADAQIASPKTTDVVAQQAQITPPPQNISPALANPTAAAPPVGQPAAVPLAGVAIEIAGMAQAGKNHFEIRLDPPELGRIEVRLAVDRDGHVTSRLIADRSDTLDLLRRDASGLERALQDAGLKTADNGLQFSLRDQTPGRQQNDTPPPKIAQIVVQDSTLATNDATISNYSRLAGLRGGIDIRV
ncbi:MAG TPA: flagellar hook-length control protein FliK [Pseudolabrys sp.]